MLKWNSNEERERLKEEIFSEIESFVYKIKESQFTDGEDSTSAEFDLGDYDDGDFESDMRYFITDVYKNTDLTDEDKADLTEDEEEDEEEIEEDEGKWYFLQNPFESRNRPW